jgi:hypothetical protein
VEEYITLTEAARRAGYRSKSTLKAAAVQGRLQTVRLGLQLFTTQAWLDAYLGHRRQGAYRRGEPKISDPTAAAPPDARSCVALVASHDPATLATLPGFGWTAPLTEQQRQQMHEEACAALADVPPGEEVEFSPVEALTANWRVAKKLLARPGFAASVSPAWKVSDFWFYGPEWQAGEREADADLAAGRYTRYESDDAFEAALAALDRPSTRGAHV